MTVRDKQRRQMRQEKDTLRAAALILALADKMRDEEIAAAADVRSRTPARWKKRADWKEEFRARHEAFLARLRGTWRRLDAESEARMAAHDAHVWHVRRMAALRRWGRA